MLKHELFELLSQVSNGDISTEQALARIGHLPFIQADHGLNLDPHRGIRTGISEVVFGPGKSLEQLYSAVEILAARQTPVMVTKLDEPKGCALAEKFPEGKFWKVPGIFVLNGNTDLDFPWQEYGEALIVSAGGADLPVAIEALAACQFFGVDAGFISDVGVAGLHRLLPHIDSLYKARVIIAVAGMEGALPSVVGGLCDTPVVAVPTSVGYGTSLSGITPLLAMLTSCAPGIAVVNIDNGFGAACFAVKMLRKSQGADAGG